MRKSRSFISVLTVILIMSEFAVSARAVPFLPLFGGTENTVPLVKTATSPIADGYIGNREYPAGAHESTFGNGLFVTSLFDSEDITDSFSGKISASLFSYAAYDENALHVAFSADFRDSDIIFSPSDDYFYKNKYHITLEVGLTDGESVFESFSGINLDYYFSPGVLDCVGVSGISKSFSVLSGTKIISSVNSAVPAENRDLYTDHQGTWDGARFAGESAFSAVIAENTANFIFEAAVPVGELLRCSPSFSGKLPEKPIFTVSFGMVLGNGAENLSVLTNGIPSKSLSSCGSDWKTLAENETAGKPFRAVIPGTVRIPAVIREAPPPETFESEEKDTAPAFATVTDTSDYDPAGAYTRETKDTGKFIETVPYEDDTGAAEDPLFGILTVFIAVLTFASIALAAFFLRKKEKAPENTGGKEKTKNIKKR